MARSITQLAPGFTRSHFDTRDIALHQQMQAWRDRVGHIVDTLPSKKQVDKGFCGGIDLYSVNDLVFLESYTDELRLERSLARISTDSTRFYVFYILQTGHLGNVDGLYRKQVVAQPGRAMMALDMNQPVYGHRPGCRIFNLFVPRELVESALPDAESIHGRVIQEQTPLFQLIYDHLSATHRELPRMTADEADAALRSAIHLVVAAFGKHAKLSGNARAAARAALFGQARRYIDANLHRPGLTPENLLANLKLPRHTLYRLFEHEGGIETYIRHRKLRAAADDLVNFPHVLVQDVAYGLGFGSPQDFSRVFRRTFDMAPQDFRALVLEAKRRQEKNFADRFAVGRPF